MKERLTASRLEVLCLFRDAVQQTSVARAVVIGLSVFFNQSFHYYL